MIYVFVIPNICNLLYMLYTIYSVYSIPYCNVSMILTYDAILYCTIICHNMIPPTITYCNMIYALE